MTNTTPPAIADIELREARAERLKGRDIYDVANQLGGWVGPDTEKDLADWLLRESEAAADLADEIVRLRLALTSKKDIPSPDGRMRELAKANNTLARINGDHRDEWRAKAVELMGALEPFAQALDDWGDEPDKYRDNLEIWEGAVAMNITYGDLRRARAALSTESGDG